MHLTIKKQIGKTVYPFSFEGDNLHDVVMQSRKLSFPNVYKCGLCDSDALTLSAHVAQNKYKYTEIKCLKCRAQLTFGQTQEDPDTFYLRKNEKKEYDWKAFESKDDKPKPSSTKEENDDLPF